MKEVPEKYYSELQYPTCPKCGGKLTNDSPGVWYCENTPTCNYEEYNNICVCEGECDELILSPDMNFPKLEHRFCQVPHPEGGTCLDYAIAESEYNEAEDRAFREHIKHCNDDDCDCRNY